MRAGAADPSLFDRTIEALATKEVIQLDIPLPSTVFDPFGQLRAYLVALPVDVAARQPWLNHLDAFGELISRMPEAPLAERQQCTAAMEAMFTQLTDMPARRSAGETYADRTLYYEECDGTVAELSFSKSFTDDLVKRLDPVMALSSAYGQLLQRHYKRLALRAFRKVSGDRPVLPYGVFIGALDALEAAGGLDRSDPELDTFQTYLDALVASRSEQPVIQLDRDELAPLLSDDVNLGLHTSPDLMMAAKDFSALRRGDYRLVLGEVHQFLAMWGSQLLFDKPHSLLHALLFCHGCAKSADWEEKFPAPPHKAGPP